MKVGILGTGSWGTALAQVLCDNGHDVLLWGISNKQVRDIEEFHHNYDYFEEEISHKIHATMELSFMSDRELLLSAVPSQFIEEVIEKVKPYTIHTKEFVNVSKGFHPNTHERLSEVIEKSLGNDIPIVSLIGPSHAEEVIQRKLTVVNSVSISSEAAQLVQSLFSNDYFRVYTNTDVIGAEIGVAVKNIMAIASGILEGIGQGDNAKAALITRGLAEMSRYGTAKGGKLETYLGLDGVGDLIVTCMSKHSRNYMAGYEIGKNHGAKSFLETNQKTVEGIFACKIVYEDAQKIGISMPITEEVYHVLFDEKDPSIAIHDLMSRDLKQEDYS